MAIVPTRNESDNIAGVISALKKLKLKAIIVGIDPATTDNTKALAQELGCITVQATRSGYDPVVALASAKATTTFPGSLLLYTDAGNKYSYDSLPKMLYCINTGDDMVLAVRVDVTGTMLWHQKLGTQIVLGLVNTLLRSRIRDISPFRLVKSSLLEDVTMHPKKFRWPSEMLVKSLALGLKVGQININSLPRKGTSKVSGSLKNSVRAGTEMLSSIQFINYKKE